MDAQGFWKLIEDARRRVPDPVDGDAVTAEAATLLSVQPCGEIIAADHVLRELLAQSYRNPLWAAAYLINGGCSDDAFDYFRGWLIMQGQGVFERVLTDPDSLADLPVIRAAAPDGVIDCEAALTISWNAHLRATGEQLPDDAFTTECPDLDSDWGFDFGDQVEMRRRLPRLAALYLS
ncbi:DUF4240 domain-containing protein [Streptomyces sp. FH025]|uniref:DUF4240 domain-containing protein n=1 Tax=Streptomyces sp. FH025 TaxID=2815937 RepID=UPI001A9DACC3|nr:DUF4240 domain-containing protein [Streptomyces sp. FH025]MBO1420041.1 DUF4240 domain-containing protein [Streptomyces sp. FH025]